ncbi:MAG: beta-lactamase family protein [Ignavibacteriae bacterium]|nr:beta-lactamase family protein [Ignavibacteriota bacterium]
MRPLVISNSLIILAGLFITSCTMTNDQSIAALMAEYASPNTPGAAVLVMKHDSIVFSKAYGLADLEVQRPVTPATNFRLASVTKEFTAMCIMLLADRGRLSYEDSLAKFFPDFPSYGRAITVRQLLNHTSGLVDYESLIPDSHTVQVLDRDCLALLMSVDSLYFPSGTKFQYSNTGYAFLALIIEKVSGKPFADFLRENIFEKVGMPTTVAFENGISAVQNRAYGYSFKNGKWTLTDQSVTSAVLGDGGIYSNVEEMSRWISALFSSRLISTETQRVAWTEGLLNNGTPIDYGIGWHLETYRNIRHPHHGGSTMGFRNHIHLFPEQKLMVIVLTNRNQGEPADLAHKIADLFLE